MGGAWSWCLASFPLFAPRTSSGALFPSCTLSQVPLVLTLGGFVSMTLWMLSVAWVS